jgi:hypothetical protein
MFACALVTRYPIAHDLKSIPTMTMCVVYSIDEEKLMKVRTWRSLFYAALFGVTCSSGIRADLVHQWKFNGFATDSIGTAHGTLGGGALITADGRLSLDGIGGQVLTSPIDVTLGEKTLVSWVSLNDLNQPGGGSALSVQVGNGQGASGFDGIVYGERAPQQWMNGSNGFSRSVPDNGGFAETVTEPGEVMMAITYAADNSIQIFRDGALYATAANTSQGTLNTYTAGVANAIFGRRHDGAGNPLNGYINEARIYNEVLSPTAIQDLFFNGPDLTPSDPPPPPPGAQLVHQWKFNGYATDSVGSAHGVLSGGAMIDGDRLSLDGLSGQVLTSPIDQTIAEKTLVTWVSLNDLDQPGGGSAISLQVGNGNGAAGFDGIVYGERAPRQWMNGSNGFSRSVPDNGGPQETITEPGEVMLAITYKADNSIQIYRDGALYASAANASQGALNTYQGGLADVIFGRRHDGAGNPLNGYINEARVYKGVMTDQEIQDLFFNGPDLTPSDPPPAGPGTGLRHQWTFNGTLEDSVGDADGQLEGNAQVVDGRLSIDGQPGSRFISEMIGDPINAKTMVAWVSLNDPSVSNRGSVLTLQNNANGDVFDAIVYGEAAPQKWMAGSNFFDRTQNPQEYGVEETVGDPGEVMVSIVYGEDNTITLYRDGELYGSYQKGALQPFGALAMVQIGPRHGLNNDVFDGFINEARIYASALSAAEIQAIFRAGPVVPEPATITMTALSLLGLVHFARRRRVG